MLSQEVSAGRPVPPRLKASLTLYAIGNDRIKNFTNMNIFMNKILKTFCLAAAAVALASCGDSAAYKNSVEYLPFKGDKADNWGLISTDGKVLFENEFENQPSAAYNGRFTVKNSNGLYELYTAEAKPKKVGKDYKDIAHFFEDVAPAVEPDQTISYIDRDGNVKFKLDKINGQNVVKVYNYVDGLSVFILDNGLQGCIDTSGKVVVQPEWCRIGNIGDGKMLAISKKYQKTSMDSLKVSVIDYTGKVLFDYATTKYEIRSQFMDGLAIASKQVDGKDAYGILNDKGEWVVKAKEKYKGIHQIIDEKFVFLSDENKLGVASFDGEVLIRAKYETVFMIGGDRLIVADDKKEVKIINLDGEELTNDSYQNICGPFNGDNFIVKDGDNSYVFVNEKGEALDKKQELYDVEADAAEVNQILKGTPQLYTEWIESDYVDIDGLVASLKITSAGMFGLTFSSSMADAAKAAEADYNNPGASSYSSAFRFTKEYAGFDLQCTVGYDEYMVESKWNGGEVAYTWKELTPAIMSAVIPLTGKLEGKYDKVNKAVTDALTKAGWKEFTNGVECAVLENGTNIVMVGPSNNGNGLLIEMGPKDSKTMAERYDTAVPNF